MPYNKMFECMDYEIRIGRIIFKIFIDHNFFPNSIEAHSIVHNHAVYEIHYILEGEGTIVVNHTEYEMSEKGFIIIPPDTYHYYAGMSGKKCIFQFKYHIEKNTEDSVLNCHELNALMKALTNMQTGWRADKNEMYLSIQSVYSEFQNRSIGYYYKINNLINLIFIDLIRSIASSDGFDDKKIKETIPDNKRTCIIDAYFGNKYGDDVKPDELAEALGVSRRHLNRVLKTHYHKSFTQKLIETRIEAAKHLLSATDMTVKDICCFSGFNSMSYFHSVFRESTGFSPERYRKSVSKH